VSISNISVISVPLLFAALCCGMWNYWGKGEVPAEALYLDLTAFIYKFVKKNQQL